MSLFICVTLSFLMPIAESPFLMGAFILGLSVVSALILSEVSTWFALLLFLMYVGGMLVTLAYFLALCPNQAVSLTPFLILPVSFAFIFFRGSAGYQLKKSLEVVDIYSSFNFSTFLFLGAILLIAMVSVVKMVSRSAGSLRPLKV